MPLLEVSDLYISYGRIQVIRGISFVVDSGQVVSILGVNGAGKTTTMKALSGLLRPEKGQVRFRGRNIVGVPAYRVARLGLVQVPEGRQVLAPLTVEENLHLGAYARSDNTVDRDRAWVYEMFPVLYERRKQIAGSLSGGEQQMLALGRALMARPQLLLLDEPSMGLAPTVVNRVFEAIQQIHAEGIAVLMAEQNVRKALNISNYAYIMERGELVYEGMPQALQDDRRVLEAYLGQALRAS